MGIAVIKQDKEDIIMSDSELASRLVNRHNQQLNAGLTFELNDIDNLKYLAKERQEFDTYMKSSFLKRYLSVPPHVDKLAKKLFGEDYYKRKSKGFKKFLDYDFGNGIKGELFLIVPRNKL